MPTRPALALLACPRRHDREREANATIHTAADLPLSFMAERVWPLTLPEDSALKTRAKPVAGKKPLLHAKALAGACSPPALRAGKISGASTLPTSVFLARHKAYNYLITYQAQPAYYA